MYKKALQAHLGSGYYLPFGRRIVQNVYPPFVACLGRRWCFPFGAPGGLTLFSSVACDNMLAVQSWSLAIFQEGGMSPGGDIFVVAFSCIYLFNIYIFSLSFIGLPPRILEWQGQLHGQTMVNHWNI